MVKEGEYCPICGENINLKYYKCEDATFAECVDCEFSGWFQDGDYENEESS